MIYVLLFLAFLVGVYIIGRLRGRNLLPEIVISLLIGLNWEIYSAHEWVYNSSKLLMVNVWIETIPLDVVIAWGASLAATILVVYELMALFKTKSRLAFLLSSWVALFFVGLVIELVGYYGNFWGYTVKSEILLWPTAIPLRVVFGWVTLGTYNLASISFYRDWVEKKIKSVIQ